MRCRQIDVAIALGHDPRPRISPINCTSKRTQQEHFHKEESLIIAVSLPIVICPSASSRKSRQASPVKIIRFIRNTNHAYGTPPRFHRRDVSRSSRTLDAGCDGRAGFARRAKPARMAKPCGPDPPTLGSSLG
jgi:hypothetical protein